ncbi:MAG: hypothetical protein JWR64_332 [Marmoricola sp.]|nr:hypothetical protein [Marmoricola sp.]
MGPLAALLAASMTQRQTACFFSLRRSRSESPPQIPKRSSFSSAYSRQSRRTSQVRQTFLASLVEPPFSGKNASGSV